MPPGGGGTLRRFIRLRQDLLEKKLSFNPTQSLVASQEKEVDKLEDLRIIPTAPLSLFDFNRIDDAVDAKEAQFGPSKGGWRLSDDGVIGGYSSGSAVFHDLPSQDSSDSSNFKSDTRIGTNKVMPFIRWSGNIDTKIGKKSRVKKSGFCAIRSPDCSLLPFSYGVPLQSNYNALEICCRTDGRIYTVNLKASTYMEDDLYQSYITVKPEDISSSPSITQGSSNSDDNALLCEGASKNQSDWITIVMPFRDFVLTSAGQERVQQRLLDGSIIFVHIGFTLMDETDGPFQFDIGRIRAVNYDDGKILNDV